jgi:outer membrane protein TolC
MGRFIVGVTLPVIMLVFVPWNLHAQEKDTAGIALSFEEALSKTAQENQTIKQSEALVNQKEYELKAARGNYFPKVSLGANYTYMSEDIEMDFTQVRDAIAPLYKYGVFNNLPNPDPTTSPIVPILDQANSTMVMNTGGYQKILSADWTQTIQKKQFGVVNASVVQPIFMGGKITLANQAAQVKVEEAQLQKSDKYAQVYSELVERYYALVLSKKVKDVRDQVYETMQAHYTDAGKLMGQGLIANAEYLHARVYLSDADRELKKATRQVEIVNQSLLNTLAIDSVLKIEPVSNLFFNTNLEPLDYFIQQANENSPLLQQVDKKIALADKAYKAELSEYLPTIAAMGTYDIYNKDLSEYVPDYMVGIGLKWNIFEGVARPNKVKAAKYQLEQAQIYSEKANADIKTVITKQYQEINMYLEQLTELESALSFADEYYRVTDKAFGEGMATTTDIADARLQVAKVKIEQLSTVYQFDVALSKLLYYAGIPDSFSAYQQNTNAVYINF